MALRLLTAILCFASLAGAKPLTAPEKRAELEHLATIIRTQYGPYEYKTRALKTNLHALVDRYAREAETLSNLEFYYLINRFVAEFRDSHFGSRLNTNHVSKLGFLTDRVEGKALIEEVDRTVLPESKFPFERGDEVVKIGDRPAEEVIRELGAHLGTGYEETNLRAATALLAHRPASTVPPQSGKVTVTIRRGTSSIEDTVELEWQQEGDPLLENPEPTWSSPYNRTDYGMLSIRDFYEVLPQSEKSFRCSGTSRVERPKDATVLIEKPFVAYYHPTEKGNIGYLRIPHYHWRDAQNKSENDLRFRQYEWVIYQLDKQTVGLVIDQDHNCGGNVSHLERMVSLFTDRPFKGLEFQFLATRNEYLQFKTWINEDAEKTIEGEKWKGVLDLVKTTWLKGGGLTPKTTFNGDAMVMPNSVRYTHPVLVLTDELSGSGGDAFPAMMQGLGLAKIMGHRTMGAGGHVVETSPLYYSANTLRITKSLFFHPNGTPIENNGVKPDIPYRPSRNDFVYGYREYRARYLEEVLKMIP